MISAQQTFFCVLQFSKTESIISVQRAFQWRYDIATPSTKYIRHWYKQFEETGGLYKRKSPGRLRTSEEAALSVQVFFSESPRKSTRRASQELCIPQPTAWHVLRPRLVMRPYKLHMAQVLRVGDRAKRVEFKNAILQDMEDKNFLPCVNFSDEAIFYISGKVNRHNVSSWGFENSQEILKHHCDSPKFNVF